MHVGVDDVAAERECGEDGRLGRGVVALHVGRRVALGQTELLGLAQDVVIAGALLLHAGEDVVRRAVDDAHDADDLLPGQRLAQGPDDGDGAGHGRLVEEVDAGRRSDLGQLGAGDGQERLVGGDHRLAVAQGGLDQFVRGMEPPMTSTTTSTSARPTRAAASAPMRSAGMATGRDRSGLATAIPTSSRRMPVRAATSSERVSSISASAPPTLPQPSRPTRTVGAWWACGRALASSAVTSKRYSCRVTCARAAATGASRSGRSGVQAE